MKLYIVGLGPGCKEKMTVEALHCLESSDIIVGYSVYIDLVKLIFPHKTYDSTGMRKEIERCRLSLDYALEGKTVSIVCSGDAGVYGMASPIFELLEEKEEYKKIDIEVIPGLSACNSGGSVLGSPLNHDYCVISLSDLLTPKSVIEKRLRAAAIGDFNIAIYNPSSHKRKDYLSWAIGILQEEGVSLDRATGYVMNIGRDGQLHKVMTLKELKEEEVNMFTTVFIGNSSSYIKDGRLICPRGYSI